MHHIMFDIDGTLVDSYALDEACFVDAVYDVTGITINSNWAAYPHVTDAGILDTFFNSHDIANTETVTQEIKSAFIDKLNQALIGNPLKEISGAHEFLKRLNGLENVSVSLATGGWYESAMLKLTSAHIDIGDIPIASANDHIARVDIMKHAASLADATSLPCTYFGDGVWDKKACKALGYQFVLVGNKFAHEAQVDDFTDFQKLATLLNL